MVKIHHLKQSRSTRIIWLMEELDQDYELVVYDRDPVTNLAPVSLREIHPLGKAPIVDVDGTILVESAAILECLQDRIGGDKLRPAKGSAEYTRYQQWLHFAEGSAMLPVLLNMFTDGLDLGDAPLLAYAKKEEMLDFSYINNVLAESDYFAGQHFTAADIMMATVLHFAHARGMLTDYPHIGTYLARIQKRDAFVKAIAHG